MILNGFDKNSILAIFGNLSQNASILLILNEKIGLELNVLATPSRKSGQKKPALEIQYLRNCQLDEMFFCNFIRLVGMAGQF